MSGYTYMYTLEVRSYSVRKKWIGVYVLEKTGLDFAPVRVDSTTYLHQLEQITYM
jgi:hypothetical protein